MAFLCDNKVQDKYILFIAAQELAAQIGQDVDLIDLGSASTVFQAQIVHTGKIIYCTNEQKKR
ncbi:nucleotidyltransferase domain-containing protein [Niallia circulans]|uniref:nucleotidyltransferase domain-containing protein n=1 Tax=Niallia circulans TaxID=1397 RepID=UPI001F3F72B2|nr:nucleotidyltransferase domain-containing protein [Niallia circulans]